MAREYGQGRRRRMADLIADSILLVWCNRGSSDVTIEEEQQPQACRRASAFSLLRIAIPNAASWLFPNKKVLWTKSRWVPSDIRYSSFSRPVGKAFPSVSVSPPKINPKPMADVQFPARSSYPLARTNGFKPQRATLGIEAFACVGTRCLAFHLHTFGSFTLSSP